MAAAAALLGPMVGLIGAGVSAAGQSEAGAAAKAAADRQAIVDAVLGQRESEALNIAANTTQAAGQQNALQKSLQVQSVMSSARAIAGASGGGAADTSVLQTEAMISHVGAFQVAQDVFAGENRAIGQRYQAQLAKIGGQNQAAADQYQGQVAQMNAQNAAMGTLLGGFGGIAGAFGKLGAGGGGGSGLFGMSF